MQRKDVLKSLLKNIYDQPVINNSHRGDVVEMMVLAALKPMGCRFVGLGWYPWDLQIGLGDSRIRIQVKQCAAQQLWGETQKLIANFGWHKKAPFYFKKNYPDEKIEKKGWFSEIIIIGLHLRTENCDQADPHQYEFLVLPTRDLKPGQDSMVLHKALKRWTPVKWDAICDEVERVMKMTRKAA